MSQVNSKIKDDFQVVLLLSCFMGHPVCALCVGLGKVPLTKVFEAEVFENKRKSPLTEGKRQYFLNR